MYPRILIAIDGSRIAARALAEGLALARHLGADVTIMHAAAAVSGASEDSDGVLTRTQSRIALMAEVSHEATAELLDEARAAAKGAGVEAVTVLVESHHPAKAIVETADEVGAGLIVMGTHGRRGFAGLRIGSQTASVLQYSTVPVLAIRGEDAPPAPGA